MGKGIILLMLAWIPQAIVILRLVNPDASLVETVEGYPPLLVPVFLTSTFLVGAHLGVLAGATARLSDRKLRRLLRWALVDYGAISVAVALVGGAVTHGSYGGAMTSLALLAWDCLAFVVLGPTPALGVYLLDRWTRGRALA
jgi:hypothetical protein